MIQRSNSGAARVNAIYLILVFVLFMAAVFFAYTASDARVLADKQRVAAEQAEATAKQDLEAKSTQLRRLTEFVGWYPREDFGATTNLESAKAAFTDWKATWGGMTPAESTLEDALPVVRQEYLDNLQKIQTLEQQITDLRNQVSAAEQATSAVTTEKDQKIRDLESQLADLQDNAASDRTRLEGDLASSRNQFSTADSSAKQAEAALADLERARAADAAEAKNRAAILTATIAQQTGISKELPGPDGDVLATSPSLNVAYISRGARDRISTGMGFDVVSGKPGSTRLKGTLTVIEVEEDRALAKITSVADPYLPIVAGDKIFNPLYEPTGIRNAVLAGRFSGTWNESELRLLLDSIGIHVQKEMDKSTAFLIVGEPLYMDPETDEPAEEPIPVSDLAVYKDAQAEGLQIVSIADIRRFFKK